MGRPPRQSLTSMLIEAVTERIQSGQYKRGDQLPTEKDMIEEFGVSRTVVREAIANLKASGLVSTHQGKGAFVLDEGVRSFRISDGQPRGRRGGARGAGAAHRHRVRGGGAGRPAPHAGGARGASSAACEAMDAAIDAGERRSSSTSPSTARSPQATGNRHFLGLFNYLGEVLVPRARLVSTRSSRPPTTPRPCRTSCGGSARSTARSSTPSPPATATRRAPRSGCTSAAAATGWPRAPRPGLSRCRSTARTCRTSSSGWRDAPRFSHGFAGWSGGVRGLARGRARAAARRRRAGARRRGGGRGDRPRRGRGRACASASARPSRPARATEALMLLPPGPGPHPAVLLLHDHGSDVRDRQGEGASRPGTTRRAPPRPPPGRPGSTTASRSARPCWRAASRCSPPTRSAGGRGRATATTRSRRWPRT